MSSNFSFNFDNSQDSEEQDFRFVGFFLRYRGKNDKGQIVYESHKIRYDYDKRFNSEEKGAFVNNKNALIGGTYFGKNVLTLKWDNGDFRHARERFERFVNYGYVREDCQKYNREGMIVYPYIIEAPKEDTHQKDKIFLCRSSNMNAWNLPISILEGMKFQVIKKYPRRYRDEDADQEQEHVDTEECDEPSNGNNN